MSGIIQRSVKILRSRKQADTTAIGSFLSQREDFVKKAEALQKKGTEIKSDLRFLNNKAIEWKRLISETETIIHTKNNSQMRYADRVSPRNRHHDYDSYDNLPTNVSNEAIPVLKHLLMQAKGSLELTEREIVTKNALLTQTRKNHEAIISVISRLEAMDYQRSLDNSIRERYSKQNQSEAVMIEKLDSDEFERDLRRLSYTSQALLELTSKEI